MKKTSFLLCICCMTILTMTAQTRRPAAKKTTVAAKKPAAAAVKNFAIVQFDEWIKHDLFEDAENIYFLGYTSGETNALRAMNKKTGEVKILVPKKKRARPQICCAGSDGKSVFMRLEGKGLIRFNGTDVNTSEMLIEQGEWGKSFMPLANRGDKIVASPDGRYVSLVGDRVLVYDTQAKRVVRHNGNGVFKTDASVLMLNNGTVIKSCPFSLIFVKPQTSPAPEIETMSKNNCLNVDEYDIRKVGNGGGGEVSEVIYYPAANMLYAGFGEQVLKSSADNISWTEAYCLPGENKKFEHIAVLGNNSTLGVTDNYEKKFYQWNSKDFTGQPTVMKELDTGIGVPDKWTGIVTTEKVSGVTKVFTDSNHNLWLQTGDGRFVIYNPDGIQGLTNLTGKITKFDLPQEAD